MRWASARPRQLAVAVACAGGGVVVGYEGSPGWQVARVALVVAVGALAWRAAGVGGARRAAGTLGVALVAVPTGVGIAAPFLTKTGLTWRSVAGLALLVGGLVLAVAGVRDLLHLGRRRATVPAAVLAVAALLVMVWSLGQAVAATNVPPTEVGTRTPADLGFEHRDVTFPATDGVRLSAWYVPSENGAAVVVLHGAGSTRSGALDQAAVLAEAGYGVLLPDARGHGRSEGRAMDFGWYGDEDAGGAVDFLLRQPDVEGTRIGLVGMSMGGEIALGAAAAIPEVRAVVAEGATGRTAADKDWLSDVHGWRGALTERVDAVTYGFVDLLTDAGPPIALRDAVREAAPRPVLLIAGGAVDEEPDASRHIRAGAPDTVDVWVAPGTGHTAALDDHPDEWRARVVGFLDRALR